MMTTMLAFGCDQSNLCVLCMFFFFCFLLPKRREEVGRSARKRKKCTRCERRSQGDRLLTSSICLCLANFAFFSCHSPSTSLSLSFFSSEAISIWCFLQWKSGNLSETSLLGSAWNVKCYYLGSSLGCPIVSLHYVCGAYLSDNLGDVVIAGNILIYLSKKFLVFL